MFQFKKGLLTLSRRKQRTIAASVTALLLLGIIAYASIPDSNGVVYACYKKSGGTLRVIDYPVSQCDERNETLLSWNQSGSPGPVGPAGPQGDPGPQGPTGPAGGSQRTFTSVSPPYDQGSFEIMDCDVPIRSMDFVKQSETSKLRIIYTDSALILNAGTAFSVDVRIDGFPTVLEHGIRVADTIGADDFVVFGYVSGISAGTHTLTGIYDPPSLGANGSDPRCVRQGTSTIEVEEVP